MTIEEAIKGAIEGGYLSNELPEEMLLDNWDTIILEKALFDPSFWQALGKSMRLEDKPITIPSSGNVYHVGGARSLWHSLIDHLADGGSIKSYFENL